MGSSPILGDIVFAHLWFQFKLNYTFFDNQSITSVDKKIHKAAVYLGLSTNQLIFNACKRILFTGGVYSSMQWAGGVYNPQAD